MYKLQNICCNCMYLVKDQCTDELSSKIQVLHMPPPNIYVYEVYT